MARNKLSVEVKGGAEVQELLRRLPVLTVAQGGPLDRAARKAGNVVARRARQLAPNSKKSGTEKKMSKKARAKWPVPVKNTIRVKVVKYPTNAVAIVGPKSPEGNAAHFMQEKPRRLILWGKRQRTELYRIARTWIVQAFDETKSEQQSAMADSLRKDIDKIVNGGR